MTVTRRRRRILVVDDEPDVRDVLRAVFEEQGYETEGANDRIEAVQKTRAFRPGLVVTNQNMPHGSGFDFAEDLLREGIETRLVLFTGLGGDCTLARCLVHGFCDLRIKPAKSAELSGSVERHMDDPDATNLRISRAPRIMDEIVERWESRTPLADAIVLAPEAHRGQVDKARRE